MTDEEMTQEMVNKMDEWAKKIAENKLKKEMEHTPPAVAVLACIYSIVDLVKESDVVTPAAALKILENKLEEQELGGFNAMVPKNERAN
jgi:hypothetical protein